MSTEEPRQQTSLTPLPRVEDLPRSGDGISEDAVRGAFDAFRRHAAQLQAQLRVLQAAGRTSQVEPTGHAVRMDSLHLIRAASEFADTIERDAQTASAAQLQRTEEEVRRRQTELQSREGEVERYRTESERQRAEIVNAAKNEARELLAKANELTNSARAEVEQTLEWARAQAGSIMHRAQQGAEQLLRAAGLGDDAIGEVAKAIVASVEPPGEPRAPRPAEAFASAPPTSPSAAPASAEPEPPAAEAPDEGEPEPPVSPPQE